MAKPPPPPNKPPPKQVITPPPERELPPITVHKARSRFSLEILGLEMVGTVDPAATKAARMLTDGLRRQAGEDGLIRLGQSNAELIDARLMANCQNDELPCMQRIAASVRADRLVYGIVNDLGGEYYVHLTLLDAKTGLDVKWTGTTRGTERELDYTARVAFDSLIARTP